VLQRDPDHLEALNNRGNARRLLDDLPGAIADFNQAVGIAPGFAAIYYNRGLAKQESKDYRGAFDDFKRFMNLGGGVQYGLAEEVNGRLSGLKEKLDTAN
jgi:tetratricopeptide (TPR) repeat protein